MFAIALLALLAGAPMPVPQEGDSIEDLRSRLETELERQEAELQPKVDGLLLEIVAARREGSPRRAASKRAELYALPPAAALVLVERIVPPNGEDESTWRALEAGAALRRVSSPAILDRLAELARSENALVRRLAYGGLGANPNTEGARTILENLAKDAKGEDGDEITAARVRLGGDAAKAVLLDAVGRGDGSAIDTALFAAAERKLPNLGPETLTALGDREIGKRAWRGALEYLVSVPEAVQPETVQALLALALGGSLRGDDAAELTERVSRIDVARRHVQDSLDALSRSSDNRVAAAALVALSRMGDRNAQKRLMDPLDDAVDEAASGQPGPLRARGNMKTRLGDYNGAINDLKKALKEAKDAGAFEQREINIDMARAYSLYERYDKAASALDEADLTNKQREELARRPEFKALAEHPRYGEALENR